GDRWQLAVILTMRAHLAYDRGDGVGALGPLRQALRLARDSGSGERMAYAVELAAHVLQHRRRPRDVAMLVGAVEALDLRLSGKAKTRQIPLGWAVGFIQLMSGGDLRALASVVSADCDEHRVAGRSLSLERAADLALRVLDEELAAAGKSATDGEATAEAPLRPGHPDGVGVFRREGDVWIVTWAGRT